MKLQHTLRTWLVVVSAIWSCGTAIALPIISEQPQSQIVGVGTNAVFAVVASGSPPLSYQWKKDGSPLFGKTTDTLTVPGEFFNAGVYEVLVTDISGTSTSSPATLDVIEPPTISVHPISQTLSAGKNLTLGVSASGAGTLSYQWRKSGSSLTDGGSISGSGTANLTITGLQLSDSASYDVVVSNEAGPLISSEAVISVVYGGVSRTWTGAVSTNWFIIENWNPAGVPQPEDSVTLSSGTTGLSAPTTVSNLTLTGTGLLTGAGTLTVSNVFEWQGGEMSGTGQTDIPSGGSLLLTGIDGKTLINRTLNIGGSAAMSGTGTLDFWSGTINVLSGGNFQVLSNWLVLDDGIGSIPVFNNNGYFSSGESEGTPVTVFIDGVIFNNSGMLEVQTGSFYIDGAAFNNSSSVNVSSFADFDTSGGGSHTGTFNALGETTVISFSTSTHTFSGTASLTGSGYFQIYDGGTVDLQTNITVGSFIIYDGTLTGIGDLTAGYSFEWYSGTLSGSGSLNIGIETLAIISGSDTKTLSGRTIENDGYIDWSGTGNLTFNSGTLNNNIDGILLIKNDVTVQDVNGSPSPVLNNYGAIVKDTTSGVTYFIDVDFNQYGLIQLDKGIINLNGDFTASPDSELAFSLGGTTLGTEYGQLQVGGTASLDGALTVSFYNEFYPVEANSFALVNHSARSGFFSETNLANLPDGNYLDVKYNSGEVMVTVMKNLCVAAPVGLVSWWPGSSTSDVIGANSGSLIDGTFAAGKVGNAFSFDGVDDYFSTPVHGMQFGTNNFTIDGWVKTTSTKAWNAVVSFDTYSPALYIEGNGSIQLYPSTSVGSGFNDGAFHHFAVVRQNGIVYYYKDGVSIGSATYTSSINPSTFMIGWDTFSGGNFPGIIDEITVYNRALSLGEIQSVYNAGGSGKCSEPSCTQMPSDIISLWRGEWNAYDAVSTNAGSLQGTASFSQGRVGEGFSVENGGYISVPSNSSLQPPILTLEAWVYPTAISSASRNTILSHGSSTGVENSFYLGLLNGYPEFATLHTGGSQSISGTTALSVNQWYHLAATFNGTVKRIYVNGVEVGISGIGSPLVYDSAVPLTLGEDIESGVPAGLYFNGSIDEAAIYSRALAQAEIQAIYNAGTSSYGKCDSLAAPIITLQPMDQTNNVGGTTVFYVSASGTEPLTYQWKFNGAALTNGADVSGSQSSSLILYNLQYSQQGTYSVVVSNVLGVVTSSNATLTILRVPVITKYPETILTNSGVNVTFSANVTSVLQPVTFQWYKEGNPLSNGLKYFGVTTTNLLVNNVQETDSGNYWMDASNAEGSATANTYLGVYDFPSILVQPTSRTNKAGTQAIFTVIADGTGLTYQWRRGTNGTTLTNLFDDETISGSYSPSLTINNVTAADALSYSVYISNPVGSITSSLVKLSVNDPAILSNPQSQGRLLGGTAVFSVTAGGTSPLSYQWKKGTANVIPSTRVTGVTSSTLSITGLISSDLGTYKVIVSNSKGTVTSANAVLTIAIAPSILSNPTNQIKPPGGTAIFRSTVSGSSPLSYQWRKDGDNISDGFSVSGANSAALTVSPLDYSDSGSYSLRVSNDAGTVTSTAATLLVSNALPVVSIISPTNNSSFAAPAAITFSLSAFDSDGSIDRIELYGGPWGGGSYLFGSVTNSGTTNTSFTINTTNLSAGTYNFDAYVYDDLGAVNSSGTIYLFVTADCVSPASGILSWWRGELNGNDFYGQNNGTLVGGATAYGVGKVGNGLTFDGAGGVLEVGDSAGLDFETNAPVTIEMWAYRIGGGSEQNLMGKGSDCGPGNFNYRLGFDSDMGLSFNGGETNGAFSGVDLPYSRWVHLAGTFDGATFKLYMDGNLIASGAGSLGPMNTGPLKIGGLGDCPSFSGYLDEVAIYTRALSQSEVQSTYYAGSIGKCTATTKLLSATTFGGSGDQRATAISIADGGAYISGISGVNNDDGLVARFNLPPSSTPTWSNNWPGIANGDHFNSVAAIQGDGVYVAGDSYSQTSDSQGSKDAKGMMVKFPFTGATGSGFGGSIWAKQTPQGGAYTYGGKEVLNATIAAKEGTNTYIYTTGSGQSSPNNPGRLFITKMKSDSTVLWTSTDSSFTTNFSSGRSLAALNGAVYVAGRGDESSGTSGSSQTGLLRKYNSSGTAAWTVRTPGEFNGITSFGTAVYAAGSQSFFQTNGLVVKYDESGSILWYRTYSDAPEVVFNAITALGTRLYAVGYARVTTNATKDLVIVEIDPETGDAFSATVYGGSSGDEIAYGVGTDNTDLYVVGEAPGISGKDALLLRYQVSQPAVPLTILTTSLKVGELNKSYAVFLQAFGGKPSYTWSVDGGALPTGVALATNGLLNGAPSEIGEFTFMAKVTDSSSPPQITLQPLSLLVLTSNDLPAVAITYPSSGSAFTAPADFPVSIEATDINGVDRVELYGSSASSTSMQLITNFTELPYTANLSGLPAGSYIFRAVAYDSLGASNSSSIVSVRVNETGTTVIDFEALDTSVGEVTGPAVASYLEGFGIYTTNTFTSTRLVVHSQSNIVGGSTVIASSGRNIFTQTNANGKISYSLGFQNNITSFGFTRVRLQAGVRGVSHPEWRATAYDATGVELGSVGESLFTSFADVPAKTFRLDGPDIQWIRIESDNRSQAPFASPLLDDFVIYGSLANVPPTVTITAPGESASYSEPADISISAQAFDSDGTIQQVSFYLSSFSSPAPWLIGSVPSTFQTALVDISVEQLAAGNYTVRAIATDNGGAVRSSIPVNFTVTTVAGVTVINFDALAASTKNVGGTTLSNYLSFYGASIAAVSVGARVEAADANRLGDGTAVTPSSPNNVLTEVGLNSAVAYSLRFDLPQQSVRWTRPALNPGNSPVTHPKWKARAFNISGTELASVQESLISSSTNVPAETFKLVAADIAWVRFESDGSGRTMFPAVLIDDVILDSNPTDLPLSVDLTSPLDGGIFTAPANITVSANALATESTISRVEFYVGSTLVGIDLEAPYSLVWSNVLTGSYSLRARVVDSSQNAQWSSTIGITVEAGVSGDATIVNFDSLNATLGSVSGSTLTTYLGAYGITATATTTGSSLVVQNQSNAGGGSKVEASSAPNIFTQSGPNEVLSLSLDFADPLQSLQFTRPRLKAGSSGITHPAWVATAYDSTGNAVDALTEGFTFSYTDVDPTVYVLQGLGITKVTFDSYNYNSALFKGVLLDDLILTAMSSNLPPIVTITEPVSDNVFLAPATVTFTVDAYDLDGTVNNVQFFVGETSVGTKTNAPYSLTLSNFLVGKYTFSAVATDDSGASRTSSSVMIKVDPAPDVFGILTHPQSREVAIGETVTFSVTTTDVGTPLYQWRFNGVNLSGKTTSQLTLFNCQATNAGSYDVVVANGTTVVISDTAELSLVQTPSITTHPEGQTADEGDTVTFTVEATGSSPLYYQWLLNGNKISGETAETLTVSNVSPLDSGNYAVVVANRIGAVVSERANLSVTSGSGVSTWADNFEERIEINPLVGATVGNNSSASLETGEPLHAAKVGGKSIWFTWHATFSGVISITTRGSSFDTLMAIYTGTSLESLTEVAADDDAGGNLTSKVTFNCIEGTDYHIAIDGFRGASGNVVVGMPLNGYRVLDSGFDEQIPVITLQPEGGSFLGGEEITLTVVATSPTALSYQWSFNGNPVSGATTSEFQVTAFDTSQVGGYSVQVVNEYGSADSQLADLQIVNADVEDLNQVSSRDKLGDMEEFGIEENNLIPRKNSEGNVGSTPVFSGSQVFSTVGSSKEEGEFNHAGEPGGASKWFRFDSSTNATMHINTDGSSFNTVLAVYTGPILDFDFLTEVDSDNSSSGSGGDEVRFSATSGTTYYIAVDGVGGASGTVNLNIHLGESPSIQSAPTSKIVAPNANATFTVDADGSTALNYQWKFNGVSISGATQSTYTRSTVQNSHVGGYTVVISNVINVVTSSPSASLTIQNPPVITVEPVGKTADAGTSVSVKATVTGSSPFTYRWRFNGVTISGATKSSYALNPIQTTNAGSYTVVITNIVGSVTSASAVLVINVPKPKLVSHKNNQVVSTNALAISGTASDKARLTQVKFNVNGGTFTTATGTASWSGTANLIPGTNTLSIKAIDASGFESALSTYTIFYFNQSILTLNTNGRGFVTSTPNGNYGTPTNQASLAIGKPFKIKAFADTNWLFTNWTGSGGSHLSTNAEYTFIMTSNLQLNANFITNPFVQAAGQYYGLFFETNDFSHHNSGFFVFKTTSKLKYSGKLFLEGDTISVSGAFGVPGRAEKTLLRTSLGKSNLYLTLRLPFGTDKISGTLSNVSGIDPWIVSLNGDRVVWSATNLASTYATNYAIAIPGTNSAAPTGWSYAFVKVDLVGKIKASGFTADGKLISQSAYVSKTGQWPFFNSDRKTLYPRTLIVNSKTNTTLDGSMLGWLTFSTNTPAGKTTRAPQGNVSWIKTQGTNGYYNSGFTNLNTVLASRYVKPSSGTRILTASTGKLIFSAGNLPATFTNTFTLATDNKFTSVSGTNLVTAAYDTGNSALKTTSKFTHPAAPSVPMRIYAVALQDYNYARGFFLGTNTAGALRIDP